MFSANTNMREDLCAVCHPSLSIQSFILKEFWKNRSQLELDSFFEKENVELGCPFATFNIPCICSLSFDYFSKIVRNI